MQRKISQCRTRLVDVTFGGAASLPDVSMTIRGVPKMPLSQWMTSALAFRKSIYVELRNILGGTGGTNQRLHDTEPTDTMSFFNGGRGRVAPSPQRPSSQQKEPTPDKPLLPAENQP